MSYRQWLRGDKGSNAPIFWIQGKPGSGKSTLMKFAMQDPRTLELLGNTATRTWKLVAFFFHDRGSEIQRSLDGMMQEILHSILQQHPPLLSVVTSLYLELVKSQRVKVPKWDTVTLQTALLNIARVRNPGMRLCLFLDALDEHGGDNEKLATLLKEMINSTDSETMKIRVCLASRSWSVFTKHFGNCPGFAIHEHTVEDIRSYTTGRLTPDSLGSQHLLNLNQLATITARITEKSSGVFIWVRLVVDQLSKDIQDGTPFQDLEHRVMKMPPELEDLYAHTLRRIEAVYCDESYMMLQIAYCSISPLPLQTFMECVSYNRDNPYPELGTRPPDTNVTENTSLDTQLRRLASRTGGLLEAISNTSRPVSEGSRMGWQQQGYHVQFIHQTVKEYVGKYRHNLGLAQLSHDVQRQNGYYFLLSPNVLSKDVVPAWTLPLRGNLFTYAKRLESSIDPSDHQFYCTLLQRIAFGFRNSDVVLCLGQAPQQLREYITAYFNSLSSTVRTADNLRELAFIVSAVAANLILYIRKGMTQRFSAYLDLFSENEWSAWCQEKRNWIFRSLLHLAVAGPEFVQCEGFDHCAMIESLVELGWPVDGYATPVFDDPWYRAPNSNPMLNHLQVTPLAYLVRSKNFNTRSEERRLQIAKTLLKLGASVDARIAIKVSGPCAHTSLLEYCIRYGTYTAPFVRLFLQHSAPKFLQTSTYSLGGLALLRGDKDIIQALKDHGVTLASSPFPVGGLPEFESIPEVVANISRYLTLIVPHGQAIPEDLNKARRRLRLKMPQG